MSDKIFFENKIFTVLQTLFFFNYLYVLRYKKVCDDLKLNIVPKLKYMQKFEIALQSYFKLLRSHEIAIIRATK